MSSVISEFMARYAREYDFYATAARTAQHRLEEALDAAGIRCIVTSRAKSPKQLERKLRHRHRDRPYTSTSDIYADIVDLAGVRVALYFPGEQERAGAIIRSLFSETGPTRTFPRPGEESQDRRFAGYCAQHYRVVLEGGPDAKGTPRADAPIEIQVASVLMHAWAEVEHDLVYKPVQGELSETEHTLLDQLNGLVLAGEIALEQLQAAGERRVARRGRRFDNHYELATHLLDHGSRTGDDTVDPRGLGRVDLLFLLLRGTRNDTPDSLAPYLAQAHAGGALPLADQVIELILSADPAGYSAYAAMEPEDVFGPGTDATPERREALRHFFEQLALLESALAPVRAAARARPSDDGTTRESTASPAWSDPDAVDEYRRVLAYRDLTVHGALLPTASALQLYSERAASLARRVTTVPQA